LEKFVFPQDKVLLFGLGYCAYCKATQKYLSRRLSDFVYIDVCALEGAAQAEALDAVSAVNPAQSFPTIVFGDTGLALVGYDTIKLNENLEIMLTKYPHTHKQPEEAEKHGALSILKQQIGNKMDQAGLRTRNRKNKPQSN
jgi:glutaredoxin